jgi:hypothetical protein
MSDLAARVAAGFRDARSRLDKVEGTWQTPTAEHPIIGQNVRLADFRFVAAVTTSRRQLDALEQIAGLHGRRVYLGPEIVCSDDEDSWPCPTLLAVAAGLGIEL